MPRPFRVLFPFLLAASITAQEPAAEPGPSITTTSLGELEANQAGGAGRAADEGFRPWPHVVFSPDGSRFAYVSHRNGKSYPVVDGESGKPWNFLSRPVFSQDSKHALFRAGRRIASNKEAWVVLKDGKASKPTGWISDIAVAPKGDVAFLEQPNARIQGDGSYSESSASLRFGKRRSRSFPSMMLYPFAPIMVNGGKSVACVAQDKGGSRVLLLHKNGKQRFLPKESHPIIDHFAFSPDGKRLAIAASQFPPGMPRDGLPPGMADSKQLIHCGGKSFGGDMDGAGVPVFSPKGKVLAFKVLQGDRMGIATDRQSQVTAEHAFVSAPVFSPNGKRLAFAAYGGDPATPMLALSKLGDLTPITDRTCRLVVREVDAPGKPEGEEFETVENITFAPNGKSLAFVGQLDGNQWLIWGGKRAGPYRQVGPPQFGPKGKSVSFGAVDGNKVIWVVLE